MFPIGTTAPRVGTPSVVYLLIASCTLVFLFEASLSERQMFEFVARYGLIPRRYEDPLWATRVGLEPGDYLPFLTMAFLHGGVLHLVVNMWTLYLFGRAVETRMGRLRFVLLYLLCALLASWSHTLVYPESEVPTLGASGAIAGVLGAHASLYPQSRVVILVLLVFIPLFFQISALWYVAIWFALQILQGAGALMQPSIGGGVAWWAHIGGFMAGLAFVQFLTPPPSQQQRSAGARE